MFFNLSTSRVDNFPYHYTLPNGLVLNTDDGWELYIADSHTVVIKGYVNKCSLSDIIDDLIIQDIPTYKGNFCAFVANSEHVKILHDTNRGFPLWSDDKSITNLSKLKEEHWVDSIITVSSGFTISKKWFTAYNKSVDTLTDDQTLDKLHNIICESYEQFLTHNDKPLKMFLSGGIDTTTAWAYLDHFTKNYELVDYEYIKFTPFYKLNYGIVKEEHWGYNQIHLWDEDCVLVTGGNGDENFLRGPLTLALSMKSHGIVFDDVVKPSDYHYTYLNRYCPELYDTVNASYPGIQDIQDYILNRNVNDHQHWHLDKTITFTPFKDIDLLALVVNSSKDLIIAQARDGFINRELIKRMDPHKLSVLSRQKNKNPLENL